MENSVYSKRVEFGKLIRSETKGLSKHNFKLIYIDFDQKRVIYSYNTVDEVRGIDVYLDSRETPSYHKVRNPEDRKLFQTFVEKVRLKMAFC